MGRSHATTRKAGVPQGDGEELTREEGHSMEAAVTEAQDMMKTSTRYAPSQQNTRKRLPAKGMQWKDQLWGNHGPPRDCAPRTAVAEEGEM